MKSGVLLLVLGGLLALPAAAHEGDIFRPFVSAEYFYDDNLFRLDKAENPREDRYAVYQAGINIDWKQGHQQFLVNVSKTRIRYNTNTFLDFDGDDVSATWNWRLGNHVSGNAGASQSTSQSSFDNLGLVNNAVDRERRFARADWAFHPRWRIGGGVARTQNTNSAPTQISQNFDQDSYDFSLTYRTPKGSNLRVLMRRNQADFPNGQTVGGFAADNSFDQTEYLLAGDWQFSGKLTVRGEMGRVSRDYLNDPPPSALLVLQRPDFSGFTARGTADWFLTAKTLVSLTAYQELGGASDINASSVEKRGAQLNGVWLVREKWRLNAGFNFENRDFKGDASAGLVRTDDTSSVSLSASYSPIRAVALDLGVRSGRRDSNFVNDDYRFQTVFAHVRADF